MSNKRKIWKFTLDNPAPLIEMPAGAHVVEFACQRGQLCMWAVVDPAAPRVKRRFHIVGTDHEFEAWWTARSMSHAIAGLQARWSPSRLIADCEAKRKIIEQHPQDTDGNCYGGGIRCAGGVIDTPSDQMKRCLTLRLLAAPYAHLAGYKEEWRP